jgi:hypothetical protein
MRFLIVGTGLCPVQAGWSPAFTRESKDSCLLQSSSGSNGGVLSFRKYCASNGAAIVLNTNGV